VKGESLALVSLGCAKNAADLEVMAGNLVKKGCVLSPDPDCADTVIVNTCAFIAPAREEAEAEICRALELKRRGAYRKVVVAGCYPQRYPKAIDRFPGVDVWQGVPQEWIEPKLPALRFTGKAFAYLKIAEGCNHRCSYCAIPKIRGKYRSRPFASIMKEARALVATGCREINVIAQDPMLWRDGERGLVDLLWSLDAIPGDFWVRVLYSYPSEITEDYLNWMLNAKSAVRYADVPLQHTVPEVLVKMNRKQTIAASEVVADALREVIPGITVRTTVMTGFPGETEARFKQMLADLKRMQFDKLGAFAYSPEVGTKGEKMRSRPSRKVALERERAVMEQQAKIWAVKAKRMIGSVHRALVVAPGVARMESQAPDVDGVTYLKGRAAEVPVGEFLEIKIRKVKGFDFIAEMKEN
jgi:ribosomal protein S12 methylthiotransferase